MPFWSPSGSVKEPADSQWPQDRSQLPMSSQGTVKRSNDMEAKSQSNPTTSKTLTAGNIEEHALPLPVQSQTIPSGTSRKQSVRFGSKWSRIWHKFQRQLGPGTAPSSAETVQMRLSPWPVDDGSREENGATGVVVVDRLWNDLDSGSESTDDDGTAPDVSRASPPKLSFWRDPELRAANANVLYKVWFFLREATVRFFYPKGDWSEEQEVHYQKVCYTSTLNNSLMRFHRRIGS